MRYFIIKREREIDAVVALTRMYNDRGNLSCKWSKGVLHVIITNCDNNIAERVCIVGEEV